jgi:uncharacterized alkaline shock family protein YloU
VAEKTEANKAGAKRTAAKRTAARRTGAKQTAKEPKALPAKRADRLVVTNEALATIIGLAAHEVPGVVGMAPASMREGLKRILGRQQVDEGVVVTRVAQGDCEIDLHVVVAYGVNIPAVADSVRERVEYAARSLAGARVRRVRVHVAGVSHG